MGCTEASSSAEHESGQNPVAEPGPAEPNMIVSDWFPPEGIPDDLRLGPPEVIPIPDSILERLAAEEFREFDLLWSLMTTDPIP